MRAFPLAVLVTLCMVIHSPLFGDDAQGLAISSGADVPRLEIRTPVTRTLKSGETDAFRIALQSGQFAHITAHQHSGDIGLKLSDPSGKPVVAIEHSKHIPEVLSVVAESSGDYLLEIGHAPLAMLDSEYEVILDETHIATAQDCSRAAAQLAFARAHDEQLQKEVTSETRQRAIQKYIESIPLWQEAGDIAGEAGSMFDLGAMYANSGVWLNALDAYARSLELYQMVGDCYGQADAYSRIGSNLTRLGENASAIPPLTTAMQISSDIGYTRGDAGALYSLAIAHQFVGDMRKSLEHAERALPLYRRIGDLRGESNALGLVASAYGYMGERQKAIEYSIESLRITRAITDRGLEATALNNLGKLYADAGDRQEALNHYVRARAMHKSSGNRSAEAMATHNVGSIYQSVGDDQRAIDYLEQALHTWEDLGERSGMSIALTSLGLSCSYMGEPQKAVEYYERALRLGQAAGDRRQEASAIRNLGFAYQSLGEQQKAIDHFSQAVTIDHALGNRYSEAHSLYGSGLVYLDRNDLQNAQEAFSQSLSVSRSASYVRGEAGGLYGLARTEGRRGDFDAAQKDIEASLELFESLRNKVDVRELRASYLGVMSEYYEFAVDLLMQAHRKNPSKGYDVAALVMNERARARTLLETLTEAGEDIRQGVDPRLLEDERLLQHQVNRQADVLARLSGGKHTDDEVAASRRRLEELRTQYEEIQTKIRVSSPRYAALTQPAPLTLPEIQRQVVDPGTLLLEYSLGDERSYLFAVTPTSLTSYELPKRSEVESAARRTWELLTARNLNVKFETADEKRARVARSDMEYLQAAASLSDMILGPVAGELGGKKLLIVSDGSLQYVPFAALPLPGNVAGASSHSELKPYTPLIVEHEIVNLPSASTLAVLRRELGGRKPAPKLLVTIADPVFERGDERLERTPTGPKAIALVASSDPAIEVTGEVLRAAQNLDGTEDGIRSIPRLPFTRTEADAISSLAPTGQRKQAFDFAASRATVMSPDLGQYRYVHFATHGFLNARNPELSGIVLSMFDKEGKEQDGFLRAHEIYNLKLPAEMVVLSGCRTGLGKDVKGEGLLGLTRGFMYAGAARVVVSLWDVSDKATADLMTHLYKDLLSKDSTSPAAALRAAQIAMWKERRWESPYYWAPFIMQGEPR